VAKVSDVEKDIWKLQEKVEFCPVLKSHHQTELIEAGSDEAGRGCYAGPVFAAAVILPADFYHPLLNDSKQVPEENREILREIIEETAVAWAVACVDNTEIDQINILKASFRAMHIAIAQLNPQPGVLLIDGNRFTKYPGIRHHCIIKGDGIYTSIAAASILAKTHRDAYMRQLHKEFPHYGWDKNKGYGTAEHRNAIEKHGLCKYHRKSYNIEPRFVGLFDGIPDSYEVERDSYES
jgi:ribonuclease HII